VNMRCRVLAVSESGYSAWRKREPSHRQRANERLTQQIRQASERGRHGSGSPRVPAQLRAQGILCGQHRVARRMQQAGLRAVPTRRRTGTTASRHDAAVAPNGRPRDCTAPAPTRTWLTDITALWTVQGWLYLAVVLDVDARLIVGWAMAAHREESLVAAARWMALSRRKPGEELLHHSERGSQYSSLTSQTVRAPFHMQVSRSSKGDGYDHAMMESFISSLKTACVHRHTYQSPEQAQASILECIAVFANRQRCPCS
jgi:putative transposase